MTKKPAKKEKIIKRSGAKKQAILIDGIGLDLATKRLNKRVSMAKLVKSLSTGAETTVARYYTIVPFEDDSRHRSYLNALENAGLEVVVKRLPPKRITKQVGITPEMAADITAFAMGRNEFSSLGRLNASPEFAPTKNSAQLNESETDERRVITIVCPSLELSYPIAMAKELGVDTVSADFGHFAGKNVLKNAAKWVDLSDSELIWKDD